MLKQLGSDAATIDIETMVCRRGRRTKLERDEVSGSTDARKEE